MAIRATWIGSTVQTDEWRVQQGWKGSGRWTNGGEDEVERYGGDRVGSGAATRGGTGMEGEDATPARPNVASMPHQATWWTKDRTAARRMCPWTWKETRGALRRGSNPTVSTHLPHPSTWEEPIVVVRHVHRSLVPIPVDAATRRSRCATTRPCVLSSSAPRAWRRTTVTHLRPSKSSLRMRVSSMPIHLRVHHVSDATITRTDGEPVDPTGAVPRRSWIVSTNGS